MTDLEHRQVTDALRAYKTINRLLKSDEVLQEGWNRRYNLVQARNKAARRYLKVLGAVWS